MTRLHFLLVEDHLEGAALLSSFFSRFGGFDEASDIASARAFLTQTGAACRFAGVIVDVYLPDGNGLDFVREVRERDGRLPILVLTGAPERLWANEAQALGADFVFKPVKKANLERFVRKVMSTSQHDDTRLSGELLDLALRSGLSPRESQIATMMVDGVPRSALAETLGVSENTVKSTVRGLLDKTASDSLDHLVRYLMARALHRGLP